MNKVFSSADEAVAVIPDGSTIAISGFFAAGVPRELLQALIRRGTRNLTLACGCGPLVGAHQELLAMLHQGQVKKVIDSYGLFRSASKGLQDPFEQAIREGTVELEVVPMGTMAEQYRAAGAGIPAFYTPTGVGSVVEQAVVSNIVATRTPKATRNFGPVMASAARVTIAEVENLVDIGGIPPDDIHTPGVYVKRVVLVPRPKFAIRMD